MSWWVRHDGTIVDPDGTGPVEDGQLSRHTTATLDGNREDERRAGLLGERRMVLPTMTAPVLLARPLPGTVGETRRVVHLFPMSEGIAERLTALCGTTFLLGDLEALNCPRGMPCTACLTRAPMPREVTP